MDWGNYPKMAQHVQLAEVREFLQTLGEAIDVCGVLMTKHLLNHLIMWVASTKA